MERHLTLVFLSLPEERSVCLRREKPVSLKLRKKFSPKTGLNFFSCSSPGYRDYVRLACLALKEPESHLEDLLLKVFLHSC
jgi:hypothetical protein